MSSASDEFWTAVDRWKSDQVPIVIELVMTSSPDLQEKFTGTVISADRPLVIFREPNTGMEHTIDFEDADISIEGFALVEPFGIVRVFNVTWANAALLSCTLMEPRETAFRS